jgi:monoamine oxidase
MSPHTNDLIDAIIVGAGAAGLMAARELKRAGKQVLVLEASNRAGGHVMTLYDTTAGVPIELGAEFIHGDAPETTRLLDEARLVTVPVMGRHYRSDRGELSPIGQAWERIGRVFAHLNPKRKNDRSFQEFLDDKPGGARLSEERELARGFVQGFFAADTTLISEKSLAEEGDPTEGAAEARRIVNGYGALIDYLQRDIVDDIRFGVSVKRVIHGESDVRVIDNANKEHRARGVVVTVPLPMLQNTIEIEPEIRTLRRAAHQLVMGTVTRVEVIVKERFWERKVDELAFVQSPKRPFNVWWTQHPLHAPVITGWAGGPPAVELSENGDVEGTAIKELTAVFGTPRRRVESLIDSIHTHDWMHDPFTRGAYSYAGVGGAYAARVLARSFGRLHLAGEATDSGSSGTVEGALATGKRAARNVLTQLS